MRVTSVEFIKNYGALADKALAEPVVITKNGRDRLVMISAEEFERLTQSDRFVRQPAKPPNLSAELLAIGAACAALPDLDHRSADEILGYDEYGLPGRW